MMIHRHGYFAAVLVLVLAAACATTRIDPIEPARCRDLPPMVPPARVTEVMAAAATLIATVGAAGPDELATAASTNPAVEYARVLVASADEDPARAAYMARSTEDVRYRKELATTMPGDRRLAQLEDAFQRHSVDELDAVLDRWHVEVQPRDANDVQHLSAAERSAYALFAEFMRPGAVPTPVTDRTSAPGLPQSALYVVIPTTLTVRCVTAALAALPEPLKPDHTDLDAYDTQLDDFRPPLDVGQPLPLYMTTEREAILMSFLGANAWDLGPDDEAFPSRPEADTDARAEFWRQRVPLLSGHWGGWHLASDPLIGITFNDDMTAAWIQFQQGYQGGTSRAELSNGKWVIIETQWEWIE